MKNNRTLNYSIDCYLGSNVSDETKQKIYNLSMKYHETFFFLVTRGYSVDYALANCVKWYEFIHNSITPIDYNDLHRIGIMGKQACKAGIKIRKLLTQELN